VLLGALSAQLDTPVKDWLAVIESRVPQKHVEANRKAFPFGPGARDTGKSERARRSHAYLES